MSDSMRVSFCITSNGPNDKKLVAKSQKAFEALINQVRKIKQEVKLEQVQEVGDFILSNLSLSIIEQQDSDTIFVGHYHPEPLIRGYSPNLQVVFFIERVPLFVPIDERSKAFAFFYRNNGIEGELGRLENFIGLRNPAEFTPFFQAVNLFHEAKHALDHRRQSDYVSLPLAQREIPAHLVEILILQHYGGRALIRIARKYVERIEKKTGFPAEQWKKEIMKESISRYDTDLDRIFGKAASVREENLRMDRLMFGFICNARFLA